MKLLSMRLHRFLDKIGEMARLMLTGTVLHDAHHVTLVPKLNVLILLTATVP